MTTEIGNTPTPKIEEYYLLTGSMSQALELLSVPNLLSKREKIERDILSVKKKADIHMDHMKALNTIAVQACNADITTVSTMYMDETNSPTKKLSLKYKIERLRHKLDNLTHLSRPPYCVNCDLKVTALTEQLNMIDVILKQRNVTTP